MGRPARRPWSLDPEQIYDLGPGPLPRRELPWRLVGCPACGARHYNDESCPSLRVRPSTRDEANAFVKQHHRHHKPVVGYRFASAAELGPKLVGVVIVGNPVARMADDGLTAEVTRCCTDGTANAASKLYSAAAAAAGGMGFQKIQTYILPEEGGASLRAAGWVCEGPAGGGEWSRPGRRRARADNPQKKVRWTKALGKSSDRR